MDVIAQMIAEKDMNQIIKLDMEKETIEAAAERFFKIQEEGHWFYTPIREREGFVAGAKWQQENTNINALNFEIDALKREIKVLKHQQEQDKNKYSEEEVQDYAEYYNAVANPKTVKDYFKNK